MSTKYRGQKIPVNFGTQTITGYIVDSSENSKEGEETELADETGDIVGHISGYGVKYSRSVSLIPVLAEGAAAPSAPEPGDTFTMGDDFKMIVKSVKISRAKKDVEKWEISGTAYPNVDMEPVNAGQ